MLLVWSGFRADRYALTELKLERTRAQRESIRGETGAVQPGAHAARKSLSSAWGFKSRQFVVNAWLVYIHYRSRVQVSFNVLDIQEPGGPKIALAALLTGIRNRPPGAVGIIGPTGSAAAVIIIKRHHRRLTNLDWLTPYLLTQGLQEDIKPQMELSI